LERLAVKPVVLVQLSDIHFTGATDTKAARHESIRLDLTRDLKQMREVVGDASTIVVTGDIAFSGDPGEYRVAGEWLDEVVALVGTQLAKILTVPGNHDVDCSKVGESAELAHKMLRECAGDELDSKLQRLLKDPARPLMSKLDNYNRFAARYNCETPEDGRAWETTFSLGGGYDLAVRGLCSVFNSDKNDRQRLMIGRGQSTLFAEEGKIYLVLAHHGTADLRDGEVLRDTIRDRAIALLTGHRHAQRIRDVDGCVEITAGAVNPEEETGWYPSYNWLRISLIDDAQPPQLMMEVWHREWRPQWNGFGAGSRDGGPQVWKPKVPEHAVISDGSLLAGAARGAAGPDSDASGSSGDGQAGSGGSASGQDEEPAVAAEGTAEIRPAMEDEHGDVPLERRVRRALFDLGPLDQVNVLTECGVLTDDDWGKPYVTMIGDAISAAAERGLLERLNEAVRAASAKESR
jgi:hypothetical protein